MQCRAFEHLFHSFIESCLHPSHLTVQQLLRYHLLNEAYLILESLKNPNDRARALESYIQEILQKDTEQAVKLSHTLPPSSQRSQLAVKIIASCLDRKSADVALNFAQSVDKGEERDTLLHEMALLLTQRRKLPQALAVVEKMENTALIAYSKSNIVRLLARQNQFPKAKEIAHSIQERDYREDAFSEIVKAYLQIRRVDDAIQFVESIQQPYEKKKSAKVIEAAMKAYHLDEKVDRVRKIFALPAAPIRRVA